MTKTNLSLGDLNIRDKEFRKVLINTACIYNDLYNSVIDDTTGGITTSFMRKVMDGLLADLSGELNRNFKLLKKDSDTYSRIVKRAIEKAEFNEGFDSGR